MKIPLLELVCMDNSLTPCVLFSISFVYLQALVFLRHVTGSNMFPYNPYKPQNRAQSFLESKGSSMGQHSTAFHDVNLTKYLGNGATGGSEGVAWPPRQLRFIKTSHLSQGQWMNSDQVLSLIESGRGFIDMTDAIRSFAGHGRSGKLPLSSQKIKNKTFPIPKKMRYRKGVEKHIDKIEMKKVQGFIQNLSDFHTRFYWTEEGAKASVWLQSYAKELITHYTGDTFTYTFTKKDPWRQKSVFVRMEGRGRLSGETIIFTSHIDSVNVDCVRDIRKPCDEKRSPGADDNGTGSSVLIELLRIFVESGFVPMRTVEWHWYTAEEVGSRGSLAVAIEYWKKKKNVVGVFNFDSLGWAPSKDVKKVGLQTIGVYEPLVQFLRTLTDSYLSIPWTNNDMCPYCSSDFASWTEMGYPACHTSEVQLSPYLHTLNDTIDKINFDYVKEFVKLAVAIGIEYAEPYVDEEDDE